MTGFNPVHDKIDAFLHRLGGDKDAFRKDKQRRLEQEKHRIRRNRKGERIDENWLRHYEGQLEERGARTVNAQDAGDSEESEETLVPSLAQKSKANWESFPVTHDFPTRSLPVRSFSDSSILQSKRGSIAPQQARNWSTVATPPIESSPNSMTASRGNEGIPLILYPSTTDGRLFEEVGRMPHQLRTDLNGMEEHLPRIDDSRNGMEEYINDTVMNSFRYQQFSPPIGSPSRRELGHLQEIQNGNDEDDRRQSIKGAKSSKSKTKQRAKSKVGSPAQRKYSSDTSSTSGMSSNLLQFAPDDNYPIFNDPGCRNPSSNLGESSHRGSGRFNAIQPFEPTQGLKRQSSGSRSSVHGNISSFPTEKQDNRKRNQDKPSSGRMRQVKAYEHEGVDFIQKRNSKKPNVEMSPLLKGQLQRGPPPRLPSQQQLKYPQLDDMTKRYAERMRSNQASAATRSQIQGKGNSSLTTDDMGRPSPTHLRPHMGARYEPAYVESSSSSDLSIQHSSGEEKVQQTSQLPGSVASIPSTLNRGLGDMTRSYIDGMILPSDLEDSKDDTNAGRRASHVPQTEFGRKLGDMTRTYVDGMLPPEDVSDKTKKQGWWRLWR